MAKSGKTLTIFLIVIAILLLSLTTITIFFFQKEREMRKAAQHELSRAQQRIQQLKTDLKEAKKQTYLLEERNKEKEETIASLENDLDFIKGVRDQIKEEKQALEKRLEDEKESKTILMDDLVEAKSRIGELEEKLKKKEAQLKQLLDFSKAQKKDTGVSKNDLNKSSFGEKEDSKGVKGDLSAKILSINKENNFLIFNRGKPDGIKEGMVFSVVRRNKILGTVRVVRVQDEMSVADILPPLKTSSIKTSDKVEIKE